tara:strand:- start:359 stop:1237 length:879 start_codon:yes stop_codon:yes gene_type:complete
MSDGIDLNLDNYELQDLLNLFKLDYNFSLEDLKQAKKMVMKTHPDKSNLPKEYFLFFCSAFKVIVSIHKFRKSGNAEQSTEYVPDNEEDEAKELMLKKLANKPNFNKIFNELFEKHRVTDEDSAGGYGDWLKSDEDIDTSVVTKNNMHAAFEAKKSKARGELAIKANIVEMGGDGYGQSDLVGSVPESYGSALFSNLGYEDLRKAHVETVIPVTQEDLNARPVYANEQDLRHHRDIDRGKPMTKEESNQYLNERRDREGKNDVLRAFRLAKQDEETKRANDAWMSGFKRLGY